MTEKLRVLPSRRIQPGWTRDLMSGALPGFRQGDFTLVEDSRAGAIVSMLNLIPHTWSYGGIEISVGRIELVSTIWGIW